MKSDKEFQEKANDVIDKLGDLLNNFSYDEQSEVVYNALRLQHRTLQQNFWRCIVGVMKRYIEIPYDDRNKSSVNFCRKTVEFIEENDLNFFPTV